MEDCYSVQSWVFEMSFEERMLRDDCFWLRTNAGEPHCDSQNQQGHQRLSTWQFK